MQSRKTGRKHRYARDDDIQKGTSCCSRGEGEQGGAQIKDMRHACCIEEEGKDSMRDELKDRYVTGGTKPIIA
jgi:hypothetical protein